MEKQYKQNKQKLYTHINNLRRKTTTEPTRYKKKEVLELRTLFLANSDLMPGIQKGAQVWDSIKKIIKNNVPKNSDEDNENTILLDDGKELFPDHALFVKLQEVLHNLPMKEIKERKEVSHELRKDLETVFYEHLKYQTFLTSLVKSLSDSNTEAASRSNGAWLLSEIFCDSYSTDLYKNPAEISYLKLAKNIGQNLIDLRIRRYLNQASVNDVIHIQNYFKQLIAMKIFDSKDIIKNVTDSKEQKSMISHYIREMHYTEARLFEKKHLANLIRLFSLRLLQKLVEENRIEKNKGGNDDILVELFNQLKDAEDKNIKDFLRSFARKITYEFERGCVELIGNEMLTLLKHKKIIYSGSNTRGTGNKRTSLWVKFINENYIASMSADLPSIYFDDPALFAEREAGKIEIKEVNKENNKETILNILKQKQSTVNNNYYITGEMRDKANFEAAKINTRFSINIDFALPFFKTFFKILKEVQSSETYNLSALSKETLDNAFTLAGQIYELNLNELYRTAKTEKKKLLILNLLGYGFDFTNKTSLKEYIIDKFTLEWKDFSEYLLPHIYKIQSKKIILNETIYQFMVMLNFKYFHYNWFSDSRGRKQMLSLLTLQNTPLIRCLIGFYNAPKLEDKLYAELEKIRSKIYDPAWTPEMFVKARKDYKTYSWPLTPEEHVVEELDEKCDIKVAALTRLFEKKLKEYNPAGTIQKDDDFMTVLKKVPIGKAFLYFATLLDYNKFYLDPVECTFTHFLGFDASNSGLQMLAIVFKSYDLAKNCNLVLDTEYNQNDSYTQGSTTINAVTEQMLIYLKEINIYSKNIDKNNPEHVKMLKELLSPTDFYNKLKDPKNWNRPQNDDDINKKISLLRKYEHLKKCMSNDSIKELFTTRTMLKVLCMTYPYGVTRIGGERQMLAKFILESLKKGIWISNVELREIRKVIRIIYELFLCWFKKDFNLSAVLREGVEKFYKSGKKQGPLLLKFTSRFFTFRMDPVKSKYIRIQKNPIKTFKAKRLTLRKPTKHRDFQKLRRSLPANFIHFCDATIVSLFTELRVALHKEDPREFLLAYTNHDAFFTSPLDALNLRDYLAQCYRAFYDMNLIENFKRYPAFYNFLEEKFKNSAKLTRKQLCENENFVK